MTRSSTERTSRNRLRHARNGDYRLDGWLSGTPAKVLRSIQIQLMDRGYTFSGMDVVKCLLSMDGMSEYALDMLSEEGDKLKAAKDHERAITVTRADLIAVIKEDVDRVLSKDDILRIATERKRRGGI